MFIATNLMTNEQIQYSSYQEMIDSFQGLFYPDGTVMEVSEDNGFLASYTWNENGFVE